MTVPASHCEAKLHGFRRTADGVVVSFVLHPAEVPQALALDPLGTRYMLALAQIGDDEQPVNPRGGPEPERIGSPASQATPAASDAGDAGGRTVGSIPATGAIKSPAERAVIRAALLPKDERFQAWAAQPGFRPMTEEQAADFIRIRCCGGNSRGLIAEVPEYMDRFLAMETEFKMDVGELARPR